MNRHTEDPGEGGKSGPGGREEPTLAPLRRRTPASERPQGIDVQEIRARKGGNYLLTFGDTGSGKTTLQWMIVNYLLGGSAPFHTKVSVPDKAGAADWTGRGLINHWKELSVSSTLPARTKESETDILEANLTVSTESGIPLTLEFTFLEVSGELLKLVAPRDRTVPKLPSIIRAYLENENLNFILLLMLHPDKEENDGLFASLMAFLDKEFPRVKDRLSLGIIVSKPNESLERLRQFGSIDGRTDYTSLDAEALQDYLARFCPETFQIWHGWPKEENTLLTPFYIGEVEREDNKHILEAPNYRHTEKIVYWMFKQLTGKMPGRTAWQKFKDNLSFR